MCGTRCQIAITAVHPPETTAHGLNHRLVSLFSVGQWPHPWDFSTNMPLMADEYYVRGMMDRNVPDFLTRFHILWNALFFLGFARKNKSSCSMFFVRHRALCLFFLRNRKELLVSRRTSPGGTAANSLLEAVHDLDASVLNWCKNKRPGCAPPSRTLPLRSLFLRPRVPHPRGMRGPHPAASWEPAARFSPASESSHRLPFKDGVLQRIGRCRRGLDPPL